MSKNDKINKLELSIEQVTRTSSLLNQNQIQKIFNSTPAKFKYERPAKGGGNWTYVKSSYVRKVLDSVFGFAWSFDIETSVGEAFEVAKLTNCIVVKGTLRAKVYKDKEWVELEKTQFGRAEVKWQTETIGGVKQKKVDSFSGNPLPLDFGNDMKAATSDCLKKCASLFGIAADVYEAGEFQEIEVTGSTENNERAKATDKKVKEAKDLLKAQSEAVGEQNDKSRN